jgi:ketosteroid isomerase-like protein
MNTDETRALIERYYAALTTGDRNTVAELVADECVWIPPVSAPFGRVEGGAAVVAELTGDTVKRTFDLKQPFAVEVRPRMIVDGDTAVVQQRVKATA